MVNNALNDPFSGKKTRKAEKKLVTRQFNIFYKRCSEKKETGKKRARSKRNPITNDFPHKKCSITKKNGLKNERAEHERLQGCADDEEKKTTATTTITCPKKVCNSRPSASSFEYLALRIFSRFFASSFSCRLSLQGLRYEGRPRQPWVTTISRIEASKQARRKEGRKIQRAKKKSGFFASFPCGRAALGKKRGVHTKGSST